jgi:hypothetical protein
MHYFSWNPSNEEGSQRTLRSERGYKPQPYEKEITIYKKYPVQQKYPDRYVTRKLLNWQCHHHENKPDKRPVGSLLNSQLAA